ncbi:MAG: hypothetical protein AAFX81_15480 [Pseudomonadota bacterium]
MTAALPRSLQLGPNGAGALALLVSLVWAAAFAQTDDRLAVPSDYDSAFKRQVLGESNDDWRAPDVGSTTWRRPPPSGVTDRGARLGYDPEREERNRRSEVGRYGDDDPAPVSVLRFQF